MTRPAAPAVAQVQQPVTVQPKLDAQNLLALFKEKNFTLDEVRTGERPVPRIVLAGLPRDLGKMDSVDDRKQIFVNTMLPLVLLVNEEIERDRARLMALRDSMKGVPADAATRAAPAPATPSNATGSNSAGSNSNTPTGGTVVTAALRPAAPGVAPHGATDPVPATAAPTPGAAMSPLDQVWVARLAARYGMDPTRKIDLDALLRRVDVVPVSMALAQAAEESGWGTSRFAQHGNALFGQLTWSEEEKEGITPRNRHPGDTSRFRKFEDLLECVRVYMQNLNTHDAYAQFRATRASLRRQGKPLDTMLLLNTLDKYSELGPVYVKAVRSLIRTNNLRDFDQAVLHDEPQQIVVQVKRAS
ncbi:glucosaminidase domain-containing protein [Nitrospirillum sp. BR 11164]|uniref:glucosaminidase domain-containing protein n=1 Tax=Nitrospirillum sp. BR 11164 TaxID=3104324 RepID=UPI002AFE1F77|nr:glucosaminidase domain-containing protein [Nitrospirillum sp. BR 11164]MEA1649654.1 glucosaminidase domain-containing protein [Nitrospirillum sp. BR 11164]